VIPIIRNIGIRKIFVPKNSIPLLLPIVTNLICESVIHKIRNIDTINADFLPPKTLLSINQITLVINSEITAGRKISSSGISLVLSITIKKSGKSENKNK